MRLDLRPAVILALLLVLCVSCTQNAPPETSTSTVNLVDVTRAAGLNGFRHDNGEAGEKYYAEQMGSGAGFLDYDQDGWLDIIVMGGGQWERAAPNWYKPLWLYRNRGDGTFTDVTSDAGLDGLEAYTIGVAAADYDNDGDPDFFLSNLNRNMLFRNDNGVFAEVGESAGLSQHDEWSSSALWIDGNNDGWLDLFVGNYADWTPSTDKFCPEGGTVKLYCVPADYEGISSRYFVSQGDGTFAEKTGEYGLEHALGKALGAAEWDFNQDGWSDFVVANDGEGDLLYENEGGRFIERGVPSGIAFSEHGEARAGMGIDIGVTDNTYEPSIFVGNFSEEMIGVYRYLGQGLFADRAALSRIGQPSLNTLTFGLFLIDIELDGDLDLFVANGHVYPDRLVGQDKITYRQRAQLFKNNGEGTFTETEPGESTPLSMFLVARGAAYADYDLDGDQDILVVENNGAAYLWRNDTRGHNWLRFTVTGSAGNRDGFGTRILVYTRGSRQERRIRSGSSYLSQSETAAVFGLGTHTLADSVHVFWPKGRIDTLYSIEANQALHLVEETGEWTIVDMPGIRN